jgi:hypothetical protein
MRNGFLLALAIFCASSHLYGQNPNPGQGPGPDNAPGFIGPMPTPMPGPGQFPPGPGQFPPGPMPFPPGFMPPGYAPPNMMMPFIPGLPPGIVPGPYNPFPVMPQRELPIKELPAPEKLPIKTEPKPTPPPIETPRESVPVTVSHAEGDVGCLEGACPVAVPCSTCPDRPAPNKAPLGYQCYGRVEYLYWWINDQSSPELARVVPLIGVAPPRIIGGGDLELGNQGQHGGRLTLGTWLDNANTWAVEFSGFWLPRDTDTFTVTSTGNLSITRPFFDVFTGLAAVEIVAGPASGTIDITAHTQFWGTEANIRKECKRFCSGHIDFLLGLRWVQLDEDLSIQTTSAGTLKQDFFETQNRFWGPQVGIEGEWSWGRIFVNGYGKVAIGPNHQEVSISGGSDGSLLAQPSNSGNFSRERLTTLGEAGLSVGYRCNEYLRLYAGYTIVYVNNVVRPGNQIDRNIDTSQTFAAPRFTFQESQFWVQGINAGLEFRY